MVLGYQIKDVGLHLNIDLLGTDDERGIALWKKQRQSESEKSKDEKNTSCYDFPFGNRFIKKWNWTKYIPICPTYTGELNCRSDGDRTNEEPSTYSVTGGDTVTGIPQNYGNFRYRNNHVV